MFMMLRNIEFRSIRLGITKILIKVQNFQADCMFFEFFKIFELDLKRYEQYCFIIIYTLVLKGGLYFCFERRKE